MEVLESHARVFTANETGLKLLERFLVEIQSGEYTLGMLAGELNILILRFCAMNPLEIGITYVTICRIQ